MGNKKITTLLSILFIITFALGVVGYMNRDNGSTNNGGTPTNPQFKTLAFNDKLAEVATLNEKLSSYEFVRGYNTSDTEYILASINGSTITYKISKDAFNDETITEDVTYTLNDISLAVAIQARVNIHEEGVLVKSYVLDEANRLYCVKFLANPKNHSGFDITEYTVGNIYSMAEFDAPLFDEFTNEDIYVIFKTNEGDYYTDYKFDYSEPMITKLTSNEDAVPEETPVEEQTNEEETAEPVETVPETNTTETPTEVPTETPTETTEGSENNQPTTEEVTPTEENNEQTNN